MLPCRPFVVLASGTYTEVRKRVSAFTTVTWSRDETPCPRSLLGLDRNRPSCCTSHMLLRDTRLALEATKPLHKVVLGSYHPVTSGAWVEEGNYCPQVLPFMWRAHLPLACRLQGWHRIVCGGHCFKSRANATTTRTSPLRDQSNGNTS